LKSAASFGKRGNTLLKSAITIDWSGYIHDKRASYPDKRGTIFCLILPLPRTEEILLYGEPPQILRVVPL
jgi:hypothetical protein